MRSRAGDKIYSFWIGDRGVREARVTPPVDDSGVGSLILIHLTDVGPTIPE